MSVEAILFDKDGTLFDFSATWDTWAARIIRELANGDDAQASIIANAIRYDLGNSLFFADSIVIAGTNREVAEAIFPHVSGRSLEELELFLVQSAADASLAEAVPLAAFVDDLKARGLAVGVMTNDAEISAQSQLGRAGVLEKFDFVAGFDSGFGMKPDPDPLLAFCKAAGVQPAQAVMVGDSTHDLIAGRAAGMQVLGVLTGMAGTDVLAPHADAVLPDIGHIPDWLDR
ncbi:MAG: HAD family hydrolase [Paracoccaceae bacterium]|jgi:phosphoglycolate phosphatase